MGGNILEQPDVASWGGQQQMATLGEIAQSAVDPFDAAARLEAQGYGDAVARKLGYSHVFELAERLTRHGTHENSRYYSLKLRRLFAGALGRLLVLFSGVVLCIVTLPSDASTQLMFVAGASGWIWTQVLSAGIWEGLGRGKRNTAASIGLSSLPLMTVLAVLVSVVMQSPAPMFWALWGMAASVLLIFRARLNMALMMVGSAVVTGLVAWFDPSGGSIIASVVIGSVFLSSLYVLRLEGATFLSPDKASITAQLMGLLQAGGQVVVFLVLLDLLGAHAFVGVAIAGLVAAALADPMLEVVHAGVKRIANRSTSWREGRIRAGLLGMGGVFAIVAVTAVIALLVRSWLAIDMKVSVVILATLLVAGVTAGIGLMLRTGSAVGATALALAAASLAAGTEVMSTVFLQNTTLLVATFAFLSVFVAAAIAARRMSRPASW